MLEVPLAMLISSKNVGHNFKVRYYSRLARRVKSKQHLGEGRLDEQLP